METFSALLVYCEGIHRSQRSVMRSFDVFLDLRLNKQLSKQSRRWWFGTPLRSVWRHCNTYHRKRRKLPLLPPIEQNRNQPDVTRPFCSKDSWWRHQMETFSALLALCAWNPPATGEFPSQRPVTRSFDVSFDLSLNKPLSKQSWGWWFETPSYSLWRHCNEKRIQPKACRSYEL